MNDKHFIFIGGLHRSGTSLLHEILRAHPVVSGFGNTGVPMDEGQHLQSVYPAAKAFGGAGKFGFDSASFMDEQHSLATTQNAATLFQEWSRHWDTSKRYLLEKSPPNLVRTRFLQHLFPASSFVIILRHPIAVAYATRKWSNTSIGSLMEHTLLAYERFLQDLPQLNRAYVLRYEELVLQSASQISGLLEWLGLEPFDFPNEVQSNANDPYFAKWETERFGSGEALGALSMPDQEQFEKRANVFGYSLAEPTKLFPLSWVGPQGRAGGIKRHANPGNPTAGAGGTKAESASAV